MIKKGLFKLIFENSKLYSQEEMFYLKDFAIVEIKDYEYLDDINQVLKMKIKINILDTRKFNRFLFNSNKDKIVSKNLFFLYQYNNDVKTSFISKISNKDFVNKIKIAPIVGNKINDIQSMNNLSFSNILTWDLIFIILLIIFFLFMRIKYKKKAL